MKRGVIAILIASIIVGSLVAIPFLMMPRFYWGVNIGDEFTYEITFFWNGEFSGGSIRGDYLYSLGVNNTQMVVTVTELPNLQDATNSTLFQTIVIAQNKVSCALTNGTTHPASDAFEVGGSSLEGLLSALFLPAGSWSMIDSFYPDEPIMDYWPYYTAAALQEDHFTLQYGRWGYDDFMNLTGTISLTTGVPYSISLYYTHNNEDVYLTFIMDE